MKIVYKILLGFAVALLISGCALFGDSYKPPPPAKLVSFTPTLNVHRAWSRSLGVGTGGEYLKLTPAVANNRVFASDYNGTVFAVDANSGKVIWSKNTRVNLTSGLAAAAGQIVVGSGDGQLLALNQQSGQLSWWAPISSEVLAAPTANQSVVVVKVENGQESAFNLANGKKLWTHNYQEPGLILRGSSSAQIIGNRLISGFASGVLMASNLYTGKLLWREPIAEGHGASVVQRMVDIDVNPNVVRGIIYVATYQGKIAAVRLSNGRILWSHKLSSYSGLAVASGRVFVSDSQGYVWAFDARSGAVLWKQKALIYRGVSGPAIIDNYLVVGDAMGYLHFMAQDDGHFVARTRADRGALIATPVVNGNSVYVYSSSGKLVKYIVGVSKV